MLCNIYWHVLLNYFQTSITFKNSTYNVSHETFRISFNFLLQKIILLSFTKYSGNINKKNFKSSELLPHIPIPCCSSLSNEAYPYLLQKIPLTHQFVYGLEASGASLIYKKMLLHRDSPNNSN